MKQWKNPSEKGQIYVCVEAKISSFAYAPHKIDGRWIQNSLQFETVSLIVNKNEQYCCWFNALFTNIVLTVHLENYLDILMSALPMRMLHDSWRDYLILNTLGTNSIWMPPRLSATLLSDCNPIYALHLYDRNVGDAALERQMLARNK